MKNYRTLLIEDMETEVTNSASIGSHKRFSIDDIVEVDDNETEFFDEEDTEDLDVLFEIDEDEDSEDVDTSDIVDDSDSIDGIDSNNPMNDMETKKSGNNSIDL